MSDIEDKIIEHYASLIIIMREKLNIDIPQETADNILYEWLTDKDVKKYLNNNSSKELDIMKLHEDISCSSHKLINSIKHPALKFLKNNSEINISFIQKNPKEYDTKSYIRYEKYKLSKTYNEFKENGGIGGDITNDFDKGYLTIHSEDAPKL